MSIRLSIPKSKHQWLAVALGLIATVASAIPCVQGILSYGWGTADGVIVSSREKSGTHIIGVEVAYRYTVNGREYTGNRYRFQSLLTSVNMESRDVQIALGRYPAGERVFVAVNPNDSSDSVLEAGLDYENVWPLGMGLFILLLGLGRIEEDHPAAEAAPQPARPRYRTAQILAVIGVGLLLYGAMEIYEGISSLTWPSVPGRITYSHARTASAETLLWYEYHVGNQRYVGWRYRTGGNATPFGSIAEAAAKRYPVGQTVSVYYNPRNPREALLDPGVWYGNFVIPIAAAFLLGAAWVAKKFAEIRASRS